MRPKRDETEVEKKQDRWLTPIPRVPDVHKSKAVTSAGLAHRSLDHKLPILTTRRPHQ